jgi:hypothetical protein
MLVLHKKLPHYLHNQGHDVIVSLVAPYIDQREDFKKLIGIENMVEFYVHTSEPRERDHFKAIAYIAPVSDYVNIDTTEDTPEQSFEITLRNGYSKEKYILCRYRRYYI